MKITVDINYRYTELSPALLDTILAYNLMTETTSATPLELTTFKDYLSKLVAITDNLINTNPYK